MGHNMGILIDGAYYTLNFEFLTMDTIVHIARINFPEFFYSDIRLGKNCS